jgi:phosphate transport system protein
MKTHTDQQYESELQRVADGLSRMGALVEGMIDRSIRALVDSDADAARKVIEQDREVDLLECDIDDWCIRILALRQPTASDLRFLAVSLKLVVDLERIGDLAVNIGERVIELAAHPRLKPYIDLPNMGKVAGEMVAEALAALLARDVGRAREVFGRDNVVDALYAQILRELITFMLEDPRNIYRATRLLSLAKYLERIGDHATNIAEQAIFLVEGRDVRHQRLGKPDIDTDLLVRPTRGVLFVSVEDAGRGAMAEAWARHLAPHGIEVASAGTAPAGALHPQAIQAMCEVGLDLAGIRSKSLSDMPMDRFDVVVTLSDGAVMLPVPPGVARVHWPLPDPRKATPEEGLDAFRHLRDDLAARIERLFRKPGEP